MSTLSQPIRNAEAPTIRTQPSGTTVNVGGSANLSVTASGTGTLSYQWYSNASNSNSGGTLISGATNTSYAAPTTSEGATYYYVVVTNTDVTATCNQTATATSFTAPVTVNTPPSQTTLTQLGIKDVKADHWASNQISVLVENGLIKPDATGNVKPDSGVTVNETAGLFSKVLGIASNTDSNEEAATKAEQTGLISNRPTIDRDMTRIEVAYMLAKALGIESKQVSVAEVPFRDFFLMSQDDWGVVTALYEAGIFKGFEDRTFRPNNVLTIAQIAVLLDRVLEN